MAHECVSLRDENSKYFLPGEYIVQLFTLNEGVSSKLYVVPSSKELKDKSTEFIRYVSFQEEAYNDIILGNGIFKRLEDKILNEYVMSQPPGNIINDLATQRENQIRNFFPEHLIVGIMHVGSSSIPNIKFRPSLVLNVAVRSLKEANDYIEKFIDDSHAKVLRSNEGEILISIKGNSAELHGGVYSILIYFITIFNRQWIMKRDFKNYLIEHPKEAKRYEKLKVRLAKKVSFLLLKLDDLIKSYLKDLDEIKDKEKIEQIHDKYISSFEHIKHKYYAAIKAHFVLLILHKCGHKNLFLNPDHNHSAEHSGCIVGHPEPTYFNFYNKGTEITQTHRGQQ